MNEQQKNLNKPLQSKGYQIRPSIKQPKSVAIIGGGIASACVAYALTKKDIKVTLYCKDKEVAQVIMQVHYFR